MEINIINNRYKCPSCDFLSDEKVNLEIHFKKDCEGYKHYENYQIFDPDTFGENVFKFDSFYGDVYIAKTMFEKNLYTVGVTPNVSKKINQFLLATTFYPQILYHFPCQDIIEIRPILLDKLSTLHVANEVYEGNLESIKMIILDSLKSIDQTEILMVEPKILTGEFVKCDLCGKILVNDFNYDKHNSECVKLNKLFKSKDNFSKLKKQIIVQQNKINQLEKEIVQLKKSL